MAADNLTWYLGGEQAARQWIPGRVVAVERYSIGFDDETEPKGDLGCLIAAAIVLALPLAFLLRLRFAFLVLLGLLFLLRRLLRTARRQPVDVIAAVNDDGLLVLLDATAGTLHGWRVRKAIGAWPAADLRVIVGRFYDLDITPPDDQQIRLIPTHPSPDAQAIAQALHRRDAV